MGRFLGAYDSEELDRPDLNKCPDCGSFFESDACPLCGKECPEEYRAGNRKAVKKKRITNSGSGRAYFVEWYHSWWVIGLALLFAPVIGIVLMATSPYKKSVKTLVIVLAVIFGISSWFGIGDRIFNGIANIFSEPVERSLAKDEYISSCETVTAEEFYRSAEGYIDKFVSLTLTVEEKFTDSDGNFSGEEYTTYYLCRDGEFTVLIRDCVDENPKQYIVGDTITVYGEGQGMQTIYDLEYTGHSAPTVYVAYIELK